jgi:hypothetical protein
LFVNCNRSRKLRLTTVGDPLRWPRDIPLSAKVHIKFRQQVAVTQSVYFTCGLRAMEFVFLLLLNCNINIKEIKLRCLIVFHCLFQSGVMGTCPPTGMQRPILMITTPTTTTEMHMVIRTRKWRQ